MIDYRSYSVEDLATDEKFRSWVINPAPEKSAFWNRWIHENPDKASVITLARELVLEVHEIYKDDLSPEMIDFEIQEITRLAELRKRGRRNIFSRPVWRAAAVLVLAGSLGWMYYAGQSPKTETISERPQPAVSFEPMIVKTNHTDKDMTVLLSDNSVATLMRGSSIRYPKTFGQQNRSVFLTGEAFFDVSKNPKKPFLVFTNETVTKVLGTSFRVKAFDEDNTVMVLVKTGTVSVYQKAQFENLLKKEASEVSGVVLKPNQQVVFIRDQNRLERGAVANPNLLSESSVHKELVFDEKPVTEVFEALESIYGIVIVYNAGILSECVISAQFNDENLKQRINAICQAIGASYDMINGEIIINSKGCS
jgi:transmembrane sensor